MCKVQNEVFRTKLKTSSKQTYHSKSSVKRTKMENTKKRRSLKKIKLENDEEVINLFRRNTAQGLDYVCCCCHRLLFVKQVQPYDRNTYANSEKTASVANVCINGTFLHQCTAFCSENCSRSNLWICFACHCKIIAGNIPPEAAAINMRFEPVPKELSCLNSLK